MRLINLSEFRLVTPKTDRLSTLSVGVMPDGRIHLNGKFMGKIDSPFIFFRVSGDGKQVLMEPLKECQPGSLRLPKSGDIRSTELSRELVALGLKIPAYYIVTWNEDVCMWHGVHCPEKTPPKTNTNQKKITQPRKNGLKDMIVA